MIAMFIEFSYLSISFSCDRIDDSVVFTSFLELHLSEELDRRVAASSSSCHIAQHGTISIRLRRPSILQSPDANTNRSIGSNTRSANSHGIKRPVGVESHGATLLSTVDEYLKYRVIDDATDSPRAVVCAAVQARCRELVREVRVLERVRVATVQPCVAVDCRAAGDELAGDRRREREVDLAGRDGVGAEAGDVGFEVESTGRNG